MCDVTAVFTQMWAAGESAGSEQDLNMPRTVGKKALVREGQGFSSTGTQIPDDDQKWRHGRSEQNGWRAFHLCPFTHPSCLGLEMAGQSLLSVLGRSQGWQVQSVQQSRALDLFLGSE